jgi:hypothetical protein
VRTVLAIDWSLIVRAILYALFGVVTALVAAIIGPTYDNLFVPEMSASALFPSLYAAHPGPGNFLAPAAQFSTFVLVNVVDPAITLVALGVALLYFARVWVQRWTNQLNGLLPRLVLAIVGANFTLPIAGGILSVSAALFPVIAGWDGGTWQHWVNLAGWGEIWFSWDNGALAFVLSMAEFFLVLALVLAIGVRDAVLAVLLVVLPIFTLLWPIRPLANLARRAWLLFAELAFLPCVLVIPLELAVGSPNPVLLVGFLAAALASPYLLSVSGAHLAGVGFASGAGVLHSGTQRGLGSAPSAAVGPAGPFANAYSSSGPTGRALAGSVRASGSAAAPAAAPLAVMEAVGHGALHLVRHLDKSDRPNEPPTRWAPIRGRGSG